MSFSWPDRPIGIGGRRLSRLVGSMLIVTVLSAQTEAAKPPATSVKGKPFTTGSSDVLIGYVNEQIRQGWTDNEIKPSKVADDDEWVRRVYLDLVGHIPPADVTERFLKDKDSAKRTKLIDRLLDDPAYVRN